MDFLTFICCVILIVTIGSVLTNLIDTLGNRSNEEDKGDDEDER